MSVSRRLLALVLFLAAGVAMETVNFGPDDDVAVGAAVFGTALAFGFAIGQWWAVYLVFSWLVLAAAWPDEASGASGTVLLTLLITVPLDAAVLALGIAARRFVRRH